MTFGGPAPKVRGVRPDTGDPITTVIFDLGAVLVDWDPRHLYRSLFDDESAMEEFLATVCTAEWNSEQDRGRSLAEATATLTARYPEHGELIAAYYGRWDDMVGEPIAGTVALVAELAASGVRLLALSNWSAETFPRVRPRLGFLDSFDAVVISGEVGLIKPDPRIYLHLAQRHAVDVRHCLFIDDAAKNVDAAAQLGFDAIRFSSPAQLRDELGRRGLVAVLD